MQVLKERQILIKLCVCRLVPDTAIWLWYWMLTSFLGFFLLTFSSLNRKQPRYKAVSSVHSSVRSIDEKNQETGVFFTTKTYFLLNSTSLWWARIYLLKLQFSKAWQQIVLETRSYDWPLQLLPTIIKKMERNESWLKLHKIKLMQQNQSQVIVVSIIQPNASHLTPTYFMVIYKRSWADYFETIFIFISHSSGSLLR